MPLNIEVGHITQPGATGNQTYNLASGFDPKALILVAVPCTADGVVAHASFGVGFATDRGGTAAHMYTSAFAEDNIGTSDTYRSQNMDAAIKLVDAAGAVDLEVDFVEFTSGGSSAFVLNWINLHTTASIRLNYMVIGGDDVVDAHAHEVILTTGAGAQDITLPSGFGHPDVVFFQRIANTNINADNGADIGFGFGVRGGSNRSVWWGSADNAATEASFQRIDNNSALVAGAGGTIETDIALGAEAGWPTDGYEISKSTSSFSGESTHALAIRFSGDVTITSGEGSARTTTGDTDLAVGTSTPKGLILLHTRQTTANSTDSTSTDAAEIGVGLVDGSGNERWAGAWDDDAQATASVASSAQVDDKALRIYTPSTDALDGEADCTISGSNFRLTTGDAFSAAFLYEWIAFGEASAGGTDFPLDAQPGSYTLTGTQAGVLADRTINAQPGTHAITGAAADIPHGRFIAADPGAYTLTGTAAQLLAARAVAANAGSYALNGSTAAIVAGWLFSANPGSYTLTGTAAELLLEQPGLFELNAETGTYAITGHAAGALAARLILAAPSTYTLTGTQAAPVAGRAVSADPGTLTLTGTASSLLAARLLLAAPGAHAITGVAAQIAPAGQAAPTAALRATYRETPNPTFQEPGPATHRERSRTTFREGR